MYTSNLRKVGGSIMLAVPPAILDLLHLHTGETVGMKIEQGRLIIESHPRPHYSLDELLAQCDLSRPLPAADRQWLDAPPAGGEIL